MCVLTYIYTHVYRCVFRDVAAYGEYTVALPFALVGATAGAFMCYTLSYALLRSAVIFFFEFFLHMYS